MHIYRELNTFADSLSKESLSLNVNLLVVEEVFDGELLCKREGNLIGM
jgi:hypothetical protein